MHGRTAHGFSLMELMVVIVILALLAGAVAVNLLGAAEQGRRTAALQDLQAIGKALQLYRIRTGVLPDTLEDLLDPLEGEEEGLLRSLRDDPWGRPYEYQRKSARRYRLRSHGADRSAADDDLWEPPKRT